MDSDCVENGGWGKDKANIQRHVHRHEGADSHEPGERFVCIGMDSRSYYIISRAETLFKLLRYLHFVAASLCKLLSLFLLLIGKQLLHLYDLTLSFECILELDSSRNASHTAPVSAFVEARLRDAKVCCRCVFVLIATHFTLSRFIYF